MISATSRHLDNVPNIYPAPTTTGCVNIATAEPNISSSYVVTTANTASGSFCYVDMEHHLVRQWRRSRTRWPGPKRRHEVELRAAARTWRELRPQAPPRRPSSIRRGARRMTSAAFWARCGPLKIRPTSRP